MMRLSTPTLSIAAALLSVACHDPELDGGASDAPDAGAGDAAIEGAVDDAVQYTGITRGGRVPDAPDYVAPEPADGPFEVDQVCCDRALVFEVEAGETQAVLESDFEVLDGVALSLEDGSFRTEQCIPEATAIRYRLRVTVDTDAGVFEVPRLDPEAASFEDVDGEYWNVYLIDACD